MFKPLVASKSFKNQFENRNYFFRVESNTVEAPRVKSQHSGLPDGPMPYNDNNMLCLGINKPSYVVFHVIGVCQKGEKVGAMTMDEK